MEMAVYTCIVCPRGCRIEVRGERGADPADYEVSGQACPRGAEYASAEHSTPVRTLTTTVATVGSRLRRLAVQSTGPIPRELLAEALAQVHAARVEAPVRAGEAVARDLLGTGVDVVASRDLPAF